MKSRRPPVLTSPWKIGFFVSLMLVLVSIGVAYFFTRVRTMAWPQWSDWKVVLSDATGGEGFLIQISPLVALVGLTSLASYLIITQAVRKYKRYLDSGLDYNHLIASIRRIEDIEDTGHIEKLKNHPDLKKFLMSIAESVREKTKELDERHKAIERKEKDSERQLAEQCERLVEAMRESEPERFPDTLDIEHPALRTVEDAARALLQTLAVGPGLGEPARAGLAPRVSSMDDSVRKALREVSDEIEQTTHVAKDIEKQLGDIDVTDPHEAATAGQLKKELGNLLAAIEPLEQLSESLSTLGEDTKGVAINTALKAGSGKGTQADLIQLAEDIKNVAEHFGGISKSYLELTSGIGNSIRATQTHLEQVIESAGSSETTPYDSIIGKISMWVERSVILSDKIKKLYASPEQQAGPEATVPSAHDDIQFSDHTATGPDAVAVDAVGTEPSYDPTGPDDVQIGGEGFERMDSVGSLFSETEQEASAIPGIEMDSDGVFGEMSGEENMFTELSDAGPGLSPEEPPVESPEPEQQTAVTEQGVQEQGSGDEPSLLDSLDANQLDLGSGKPDQGAKPSEVSLPSIDIGTEEDAMDLYALGAVDYDPAVHS